MLCKYYICSLMEAAGLLAIDFALLSVFYFLLKKADSSKLKFFFELSRNITSIYCIQWVILGATYFFCCELNGMAPGYPAIYIYSAILLIASFFLARLYKFLKKKYKEKRCLIKMRK